jgi:hypothetical protein
VLLLLLLLLRQVLIPLSCHLLHGLRLHNDLLLGSRQRRLPLTRRRPECTLLLLLQQRLLLQVVLMAHI